MICFTEQQLEQFVWGKAEIGQEKVNHLFDCDRCRDRYLALATLHQAMLEPLLDYPGLSDNGAGTERTNTTNILWPIRPSGPGTVVSHRLAARGEQPAELYAVSSFSNPDLKMVGRLLFNRQTHHLKLFLIAESGEIPQGYKVILAEGHLTGIVDSQGCVDLGVQPESKFKKLEIISPRGVYDFSPASAQIQKKSEHAWLMTADQSKTKIQVNIDHGDTGARYLVSCQKTEPGIERLELEVVGITNKRIISARTCDGMTLLEMGVDEEMLRICIY